MAQNVKINNATYNAVPFVKVPKADNSGDATFWDCASDTVTADKVLAGYTFHNGNGAGTGQATVPSVSQDGSTKGLTIS